MSAKIYIVLAVVIGTCLLCFAVEFTGDGWEIHGYTIDWNKVVLGLALLLSAAAIAVVKWPSTNQL